MTLGSLTPVAVETTLTAPDCVAPPTVIEELLVIVSERVGSVEARRRGTRGDRSGAGSQQSAPVTASRVSRFIEWISRGRGVCESQGYVLCALCVWDVLPIFCERCSGARRSDGTCLASCRGAVGVRRSGRVSAPACCRVLRGLIAAEIASYNEISRARRARRRRRSRVDVAGLEPRRSARQRVRRADLAEPARRALRSHGRRARRSGCRTSSAAASFIASSSTTSSTGELGTEYQLAFTVPAPGALIGITLSAATRDFDDRELALLQVARAIVIAAYRNLHDRARLDAILRASDG